MRRLLAIPISISLLGLWSGTAGAELSNYRIAEIAPAPKGAELTIAYSNTWSTPEQTAANATLKLYVYTAYKTQAELNAPDWIRPAPFHKPHAIEVGDFKCEGSGMKKIPLDYAKLGLSPGQQVLTSVCFLGCGHEWGASNGREAGQVTLPAPLAAAATASKNSRLQLGAPGPLRSGGWPLRIRARASRPANSACVWAARSALLSFRASPSARTRR